jgi:hypothetical protein
VQHLFHNNKHNCTHTVWKLVTLWSRDSVVGIVTKLQSGRSSARIRAAARNISLLENVQADCGAHPASYPMPTRALSPECSGRGVILTTHPNLATRLRTSRDLYLSVCMTSCHTQRQIFILNLTDDSVLVVLLSACIPLYSQWKTLTWRTH